MYRRHLFASAIALVAVATLAPSAHAQSNWPDKPIRLLLPYPPGGPSDIVARLAAQKMQETLKQTIVVENRAGAGGNIGTAEAARAAPDGYTWLWTTDTTFTVNPHVYKNLGFKPEALVPVTTGTQFSQTLVCNPSVGVKTLPELIAKAKSEKLSYASGGNGVPGHLAMELLKSMAGFDMGHVGYKGPAAATQDVMAGHVPCGFLAGPTVLPHVRAGKLVAIAVSGSARSPNLPDVPTVAEAGVKGYAADFSLVLMAPRGTPEPIIQRMRQAMVDAIKATDVVERLRTGDQTVVGNTPAQTAAMLAADSKKWGEVARRINLGLD